MRGKESSEFVADMRRAVGDGAVRAVCGEIEGERGGAVVWREGEIIPDRAVRAMTASRTGPRSS